MLTEIPKESINNNSMREARRAIACLYINQIAELKQEIDDILKKHSEELGEQS